jgi:hypothetical protein
MNDAAANHQRWKARETKRAEQLPTERHECDCGALWWNHSPRRETCPTCYRLEKRQ